MHDVPRDFVASTDLSQGIFDRLLPRLTMSMAIYYTQNQEHLQYALRPRRLGLEGRSLFYAVQISSDAHVVHAIYRYSNKVRPTLQSMRRIRQYSGCWLARQQSHDRFHCCEGVFSTLKKLRKSFGYPDNTLPLINNSPCENERISS